MNYWCPHQMHPLENFAPPLPEILPWIRPSYQRVVGRDKICGDWLKIVSAKSVSKSGRDSFHATKKIKFTFESAKDGEYTSLPFLDIKLCVLDRHIVTDIYSKLTDTFNYLPFSSSYPRRCARNIPYSLARRIRDIVSDESMINLRLNEMRKRLIAN